MTDSSNDSSRIIYDDANSTRTKSSSSQLSYHTEFTWNNQTYTLNETTIGSLVLLASCYDDKAFTDDELYDLVKCQPMQYFVWGVSSVLLQIILGIQIAWIIGMLAIWTEANFNSTLCRHNRRVRGPFRAALDLAEAIKEVIGGKTCPYSDSDITKALSRQPGLRYYSDAPDADGIGHVGVSSIRVRWIEINDSQRYGAMRSRTAYKRDSNSKYTATEEGED